MRTAPMAMSWGRLPSFAATSSRCSAIPTRRFADITSMDAFMLFSSAWTCA